jgi:glycine cleavage system H lipoate-binding protein
MLPWNYGFQWNAGHILFLGAFYSVLAVIAATLIAAARRSRRDLLAARVEEIGWQADFHDLPARDRVCRHVLTGEFRSRECPHAFDCRQCETHSRLIRLPPVAPPASPEEDLLGMAFPLDRFYHRGHAWARPETDGTVTVGLDELGRRLLGVPDAVDLPRPGARVEANGTAFRVHKRDANVRVLSPVDGEVVETGGADRGWYLKVKPEANGEPAFRHLLRGVEVKPWLMREMERLQLALSAEGAAPTLADGGVPVADIAASYPQTDWDAVCGEMFLEP